MHRYLAAVALCLPIASCAELPTSTPADLARQNTELAGTCPPEWEYNNSAIFLSEDRNGDGYVCVRIRYTKDGIKVHTVIDNSATTRGECSEGFVAVTADEVVNATGFNVDDNADYVVCRHTATDGTLTFTDNQSRGRS